MKLRFWMAIHEPNLLDIFLFSLSKRVLSASTAIHFHPLFSGAQETCYSQVLGVGRADVLHFAIFSDIR